MFRSTWLNKLLTVKSRSVRRRQSAQNRRRVHLQLEGLEDRITPNAVSMNAADIATLQSDIKTANANPQNQYTITLTGIGNSAKYNLSALPTGSQFLNINNGAQITINGISGNGDTLTAASDNRIFQITKATVSLNNMTLTGGLVTETGSVKGGGAILADSTISGGGAVTLTLNNVTVEQNMVTSNTTAQGGGIFMSGSGNSLKLVNCSVTNNVCASWLNQKGSSTQGGGLYVSGPSNVTISGSTIGGNKAYAGSGNWVNAIAGGTAQGGGAYISSATSVTLTDSILSGDFAQGGVGGGHGLGGGMYVNDCQKFGMSGSTVENNGAGGGSGSNGLVAAVASGGSGVGGGLFVNASGTDMSEIYSSTVKNNIASGGTGEQYFFSGDVGDYGGNGGGAYGGGIAEVGTSGITILSSSFSGNKSVGGGGGNGEKGLSVATAYAGGNGGTGGNAVGGGVFLSNSVANSSANWITNSSFTQNTAQGGDGGDGGDGGANTGATGTGGAGGAGGAASGGWGSGIYVLGAMPLYIVNTTLGANMAQGGNGGTGGAGGTGPTNNGANGATGASGNAVGGGMFSGSPVALMNDTLDENVAKGGTGLAAPTAAGGGVFVSSGDTQFGMVNNILEDNQSGVGPDMLGAMESDSDYNFISNDQAITLAGTHNITNNSTPQLGQLTTDPSTGLDYYPVLSGTAVIGAGTTASNVLDKIAAGEGVPVANITDEIGNPRVRFTASGTLIDMGAVEFPQPPTATTVLPGNPTVSYNSAAQTMSITVGVATPPGGPTVNAGTVSVLLNGSTIGTAQVIAGSATVDLSIPARQAVGSYTLVEQYSGSENLSTGTANGTLTVNPVTSATTVTPGNATVTYNSAAQTTSLTVGVSSLGGPVNGGTVSVLLNGTTIGTAQVVGGSATVNLSIPAGQAGGSYTLVENYSGSANFDPSTANGTLTVSMPPPIVPALVRLFDSIFGGVPTVNSDGTETITDYFFGFPLVVAQFDSSGHFLSATLLGFPLPNWFWNL
jgi:hypothetical protein